MKHTYCLSLLAFATTSCCSVRNLKNLVKVAFLRVVRMVERIIGVLRPDAVGVASINTGKDAYDTRIGVEINVVVQGVEYDGKLWQWTKHKGVVQLTRSLRKHK